MIIVHLDLVNHSLPDHSLANEWYLFNIKNNLCLRMGFFDRLKFPDVFVFVSTVYFICVDRFLLFLSILFVPEKVDVVTVFLRNGLDLGVATTKYMLPPLVVVESCELYPALKVLILSLNYTLLPLFICANVIILIKSIMPMVLSLFLRGDSLHLRSFQYCVPFT